MRSKKNNTLFTKIVYQIILVLNCITAVLLLCAYLTRYINPAENHSFVFIGISFPYLIIFNLIFLFFWIYWTKKYFWISLLAILLSIPNIKLFFPINLQTEKDFSNAISVMTYNLDSINNKDLIINYIKSSNCDVICLQDCHFDIKQNSIYTHSFSNNGTITLSKYPILRNKIIGNQTDCNNSFYSDIDYKGNRVRIFNCDFSSASKDSCFDHFSIPIHKIYAALDGHQEHAKEIAKSINASPYKVILCGNINESPISYTYNILYKKLSDVFVEKESGLGTTYDKKVYMLRWDYIFCDKRIIPVDYRKEKVDFSLHYPLICSFLIN